ncbi:hypothetical protein DPMN_090118 [Dreissena polymorpha]|uniref:Uncharacterized protein n=1 Tax=Dreissena polymorpha TaxID=45954 RepID=A0A9D4KY29_DREPO|nr:hypothetical protein DPMN_090118 [Dreissena polymorpha]
MGKFICHGTKRNSCYVSLCFYRWHSGRFRISHFGFHLAKSQKGTGGVCLVIPGFAALKPGTGYLGAGAVRDPC